MATSTTKALRDAVHRRHEAAVDKLGAKFAKQMGPVHMTGVEDDPLLKVANEVFQKAARRKVN
jgi:hypothetical protein